MAARPSNAPAAVGARARPSAMGSSNRPHPPCSAGSATSRILTSTGTAVALRAAGVGATGVWGFTESSGARGMRPLNQMTRGSRRVPHSNPILAICGDPGNGGRARKTGDGRARGRQMGMRRCASVARWAPREVHVAVRQFAVPDSAAGGFSPGVPAAPLQRHAGPGGKRPTDTPEKQNASANGSTRPRSVLPLRQPSRPPCVLWPCGFASPDRSGFARSEVPLPIQLPEVYTMTAILATGTFRG